jgi:hypothetical protein
MNLNSFLKFGFFLDKHNPSLENKFQFNIDKDKYKDAEFSELVKIGTSKLLQSFENIFPKNKSHVIPLSGGFDSRAILACLLEFTEAREIYTFTFGTPHTYDYDIGNLIAKKAGTNHLKIPLDSYTYTHGGMVEASLLNEHSTHLFHHPPVQLIEKYFKGYTTWSGFMGGSIVGSGLENRLSKNKKEAISKFFELNTYVGSVDLTGVKPGKFVNYLDWPELNGCQLTLDEQINFFNRQKKYTYYHVKLLGQQKLYPFLEKEWADFMLSVDNRFRKDKILYKRILDKAFPLFEYKNKTAGGLPLYPSEAEVFLRKVKFRLRQYANNYFPRSRYGISPWENFMNFNLQIRHDKKFSELIYECIKDLEKRNILDNISPREIYEDHMKGEGNHADALLVLASLEYHFKSGLDPNQLSK